LPRTASGETLNEYAQAWLKTVKGNLKASTYRFYDRNLTAYVLKQLGTRQVSSICRRDCRDLVATWRATGLKVATVKGIARTLSTILTQAVEDGLLPGNPALRLGRYLRAGDEPKRQIEPLTRGEGVHLLAVAREHFPGWHPILLCALRTGMRQGELLALQWADVDFAGGFIAVTRNIVRGVVTTPKNHRHRRVDMSSQLAQVLAALRLQQRAKALKDGESAPEVVFASREGTMRDEANLRHVFYRALEKGKMRRIRFHDLRHTFASLLIQQGESLAYVKEQMGHSSIQVTVDVYGHLVPGGNRAAVDRLDDDTTQPSATPAQPEAEIPDDQIDVSPLLGMVSRDGIEPSTRRLRVRPWGVRRVPLFHSA
jgi:integrase